MDNYKDLHHRFFRDRFIQSLEQQYKDYTVLDFFADLFIQRNLTIEQTTFLRKILYLARYHPSLVDHLRDTLAEEKNTVFKKYGDDELSIVVGQLIDALSGFKKQEELFNYRSQLPSWLNNQLAQVQPGFELFCKRTVQKMFAPVMAELSLMEQIDLAIRLGINDLPPEEIG